MGTELKRRVHQMNPCNLEELWEFGYREWYLIPVKMLKDLYTSLPRCIEEIFQLKGSHTKY